MAQFLGQEVKQLPYGPNTFLPLTLGLLAMIFSNIAAFSCNFIKIGVLGVSSEFGFWSSKFDGSCKKIEEPDGPLKFGRAVGLFIAFMSYFCLATVGFSTFIEVPKTLKKTAWILMFGITVLSLLLFVGFATETCSSTDTFASLALSCTPGAGGVLNILALFFWIGAAISFMKLEPVQTPENAEVASEIPSGGDSNVKVEVSTMKNADGTQTKTTTTTTTNADGSKTVKKQTEQIGN